MEAWGFIWVMFALKIPLGMLLYTVWWAIHQTPEEVEEGEDGGIGRHRHERPRRPRDPRRRGPHGDAVAPAPPRTRTSARATNRASR
jgi:hypothetical protein